MPNNNYRTAEIFDILSKGQFICSNAIDSQRRHLYQHIEENFDELEPKFREIGYQLENGNNYYYFSRTNESNQNIEGKIEKGISKKAVKKLPFPIVIFNFIEKNF